MRINKMKIINIFFSAITVLLLVFTAGCSGLSESEVEEKKSDGYVLSGVVSFPENTTRLSRTATFGIDDCEFEITANKINMLSGEPITSVTYKPENYSGGTSFTFNFPSSGTYLVTVKAKKDGNVIAMGAEGVTVKNGRADPVVVCLYFMGSGTTGGISLTFNLDSTAAASIKYLEMRWEEDSDLNNTYTFNSSGTLVVEEDDLPELLYHVKLNFNDDIGNTLYSCREVINVYAGCTTDTWYGEAPYLNDGVFTVTGELITSYGAQTVPATKTMLFNMYYFPGDAQDPNAQYKYNYYLVDDSQIGSAPSSPVCVSQAQTDESQIQDYTCFDSNGNFYLFQDGFSGVHSNKAGWVDPSISDYNNIRDFTIDLKTDKAYFLYGDEGTNFVYQYPSLISSNGATTSNTYMTLGAVSNMEGSLFAVYNDKIYLLIVNGNDLTYILNIYNYVAETSQTPVGQYTIDPRELFDELDPDDDIRGSITDLLYQDDALYMLYREKPDLWASDDKIVASRGGVIKFNLITRSFSSLGFTNNKLAANSGYNLATFEEHGYRIYSDENLTNSFIPTEAGFELFPDVYFPSVESGSANARNQFYGPTKFLAIKPKRLVIADEGMKFYYGDEDDNILHSANVNRIVYVDLEDFSIKEDETRSINENVSLTNDIKFDLKYNDYIGENDLDYYYLSSDSSTQHITNGQCYYLHILNDDSGN